MAIRPASHRASGQARREALLKAAVEIVAENGIGGASHRAIAARAGVPLSTTSYFFASLDEMLIEALRGVVEDSVTRLNELIPYVTGGEVSPWDTVDRAVELLLAVPRVELIAQFEAYLDATRRPDLHAAVHTAIAAFEDVARAALIAMGTTRANEGARALVALADGFTLHRLAWPRGDADRRALTEAMHALLIAYAIDEKQRRAVTAALRRTRPVNPG